MNISSGLICSTVLNAVGDNADHWLACLNLDELMLGIAFFLAEPDAGGSDPVEVLKYLIESHFLN